jgi:glycosyltransferase involved in cell wall biosynthesis
VLIQAFRRVADEVPDATLTIAGKGPLRQSLEDMTSRLHLTEKVTFAGYIEGEKVVQLYREASVFVLPSAAEGLSLALLEAMSFGKCVVVSERAHSGVIQDRVDGLIFRFDDADDLAGKLLWIFENPERSKRLSVNARQKVEREYSLEAIAPRLEQLYGEVAGVTSQ